MSDDSKTVVVNGRLAWLIDGVIIPRICGGTEDSPPADPPPDDPDPALKKVDMTQGDFDALLKKKYGEFHTKAEAKTAARIEELKAQVEALKVTDPKKTGDDKKEDKDLTALTDRLAKMEEKAKQSNEQNRRATVLTVAAELNAVNGEQVAQLVSSFIKSTDDGVLSIVNADGQDRMNEDGKPFTVKELVSEFLGANPHLVKAAGKPGSGSHKSDSSFIDTEAIAKLPLPEQLTAIREAKAGKK